MGAGPKILCLNCGTTIQSLNRHHMDCCNCKDEELSVCVDGGSDYLKMATWPGSDWIYADTVDWEDDNPPRRSKGSLPKMGVDGASVKMLSKLKGVPK